MEQWRTRAACLGATDLFFKHECNYNRCKDGCDEEEVAEARAICMGCKVLGMCWHSLGAEGNSDGVLAGTTKQERIKLRKAERGS